MTRYLKLAVIPNIVIQFANGCWIRLVRVLLLPKCALSEIYNIYSKTLFLYTFLLFRAFRKLQTSTTLLSPSDRTPIRYDYLGLNNF